MAQLFANQFVNMRLLQETLTDQVIIPIAAVQHGAPNGVNGTFVYLVGADSTVAVRPIVLGATDGERVAVTQGTAGRRRRGHRGRRSIARWRDRDSCRRR